jgi:hypothetical protein
MSDSSIGTYQQAVNQLKRAQADVERYVTTIQTASRLLGNGKWKTAMMANVSGGFPADIAFSRESINGNDWPTGQQLADVLQAYHATRQALKNAWGAIPPDERAVVHPPETYM